MTASGPPSDAHEVRDLARLGRWTVHGLFALDAGLLIAWWNELVHVAVLCAVTWGGALMVVATIRRVEAAAHPEQQEWWTWLSLLGGIVGLLAWVRHLDREH